MPKTKTPRPVAAVEADLAAAVKKRDAAAADAKKYAAELDAAQTFEAATKQVADMNDDQRAALILAAQSAPPTSAVGTPGNQ